MSDETQEKGRRGRPKAEASEKKPNIDPDKLKALKNEYVNGNRDEKGRKVAMPERKLIALRSELVRLYEAGKATADEQEFMELILRRDRKLGKIFSAHEYLLNKIEHDRCEMRCVVKSADVPLVHHMHKGLECKFDYDPEYDDGKAKPDSIGRYYVFIPRTVPTRHQLKNATVEKEILGHPTDPKEYPADKVLIHRVALKEREFEAWLEIVKADPLEDDSFGETEAEVTF
jgi:hypothetical protein